MTPLHHMTFGVSPIGYVAMEMARRGCGDLAGFWRDAPERDTPADLMLASIDLGAALWLDWLGALCAAARAFSLPDGAAADLRSDP